MSMLKGRSVSGISVLCAAFFLLLAAIELSGCSKAPSGAASADGAAKGSKTEVAQDDTMPVQAGDPAAGKIVYDKYCHFCHGTKAMGDGPIGIAIRPRPADLVHDRNRVLKTDRELFYSISEGIRRPDAEEMVMPRWKDVLTAKQRRDALAYIRQLETEYGDRDLIKKRDASRQ